MKAIRPKKIIAGVALAGVCFAAAALFPFAAPELAIVAKAMLVFGVLAVALPAFEWGAALGYRVQNEEGTLQLGPILRCLTMTVILGFISVALAAMVVVLCRAAFR